MRQLLRFVLAFAIALPFPTTAQQKVDLPRQVVPSAFLEWDQFAELSEEDQNIYLMYLAYVTGVLSIAKYPNEEIYFSPEMAASIDWRELLREVFAPNEAHALAPVVAGGIILVRGTAVAVRSPAGQRALRSMGDAWRSFTSRSGSKTLTPPGGGGVPANLKTIGGGGGRAVTVPPKNPVVQSGGTPGPIPLTATNVPRGGGSGNALPPPPGGAGAAGGAAGAGKAIVGATGTAGILCADGTICTKPKDPPADGQVPATTSSDVPPAPEPPKYARATGATCIFGSYGTTYTVGQDGGCKPPKDTVNNKACQGTKKPNFKCNDFGLATGNAKAAKSMCLPIKPKQSLKELTQSCVTAFEKLMTSKDPKQLSKDEYAKLVANIQKMLDEKSGTSLSVRAYCGRDNKNSLNESRQADECEALSRLLASVEKKIPSAGAATAAQGSVPAATAPAPAVKEQGK